jgi:hypothetical protein
MYLRAQQAWANPYYYRVRRGPQSQAGPLINVRCPQRDAARWNTSLAANKPFKAAGNPA